MTSVSVDRDTRWREILREQGRTLTWLAERTGVAQVTVFSYSQGARRPSHAWLQRAAEALGVPVDEIDGEPAQAAS